MESRARMEGEERVCPRATSPPQDEATSPNPNSNPYSPCSRAVDNERTPEASTPGSGPSSCVGTCVVDPSSPLPPFEDEHFFDCEEEESLLTISEVSSTPVIECCRSPEDPLTHSPTDPLIQSPEDLLTQSPKDSLSHYPKDPLSHYPKDPLSHYPKDLLSHYPKDPLERPPSLSPAQEPAPSSPAAPKDPAPSFQATAEASGAEHPLSSPQALQSPEMQVADCGGGWHEKQHWEGHLAPMATCAFSTPIHGRHSDSTDKVTPALTPPREGPDTGRVHAPIRGSKSTEQGPVMVHVPAGIVSARKLSSGTSGSFDSTNSSSDRSTSSISSASSRSPKFPARATSTVAHIEALTPSALGAPKLPLSMSAAAGTPGTVSSIPAKPGEGVVEDKPAQEVLDSIPVKGTVPPGTGPSSRKSQARPPGAQSPEDKPPVLVPVHLKKGGKAESSCIGMRPLRPMPPAKRPATSNTLGRTDLKGPRAPGEKLRSPSPHQHQHQAPGGARAQEEDLEPMGLQTRIGAGRAVKAESEEVVQGNKARQDKELGWLSKEWFKTPLLPVRNYSLRPGLFGRTPVGNPLHVLGPVMNSRGRTDFTDHFQMGKTVGEGSYGAVRECVHVKTGRKWACKVVRKERLLRPKDVLQARMEFYVHKKVHTHPSIIGVEDLFEDGKSLYIVMELCDGGDLFDAVTHAQGLDERSAASVFVQLLSAVRFCRSNDVLHRDIKLENVLVTTTPPRCVPRPRIPPLSSEAKPNGLSAQDGDKAKATQGSGPIIKLGDFGSALLLPQGEKAGGRTGGSKMYQAPEVLSREKYDYKADMWSLGVVLYALLSSTFPFTAPTEALLTGMIKRGVFHMTGSKWEGVSKEAKDVVVQLLKVDPVQRASVEAISSHPWVLQHSGFDPRISVSRSKSLRNG